VLVGASYPGCAGRLFQVDRGNSVCPGVCGGVGEWGVGWGGVGRGSGEAMSLADCKNGPEVGMAGGQHGKEGRR
jgi:hypothetical protein